MTDSKSGLKRQRVKEKNQDYIIVVPPQSKGSTCGFSNHTVYKFYGTLSEVKEVMYNFLGDVYEWNGEMGYILFDDIEPWQLATDSQLYSMDEDELYSMTFDDINFSTYQR